jgi:hypothetical protein
MTELGAFDERIRSWRAILASIPRPEARLKVFIEAANDIAGCTARGLSIAAAADALQEIALTQDLIENFGADEIQRITGDAFDNVEHVPDLLELPAPKPKTNGKHGPAAVLAIEPTPYLLPDEGLIPKRVWLHRHHYMRGVVTATVAPGGKGKTTLALHEAMEMVCSGLRVWYISGEDDKAEIDRRIAAHVHGRRITNETLGGRLFVDDKLSFPFKIAKSSKAGTEFDEARLAAFEAAIQHRRIDVIIIDPFISFHYLQESDTGAMDALVKRLGEICHRQQCCIELSHHVRKPAFGQSEITVYDARGAAAIVNAVRSCRVLNDMSQEEAERGGIKDDDRLRYLRIDSGKRNMAPPEKAQWAELVSVQLANGDNVQALEGYTYKLIGITDDDTEWLKIVVGAKPYRTYSQSNEWLGHPIASRFGRDPAKKGDAIWISQQIKKWERDGVIVQVTWLDEQRKKRQFYVLASDKHKFDLSAKAPKLKLDNNE